MHKGKLMHCCDGDKWYTDKETAGLMCIALIGGLLAGYAI